MEARTGERWAGTDTYIFDSNSMAVARQRLIDKGLEHGYGIHARGASTWDGLGNAYVSGQTPGHDPRVALPVELGGGRAAEGAGGKGATVSFTSGPDTLHR